MTTTSDKRTISEEGFMLADAVLAKAGELPYLKSELGIPGSDGETIMLSRSRAVLEQALPSMVGAPVTLGHPEPFVNSADATSKLVGSVVTEPRIDSEGKVRASLRIFDDEAIRRIQAGENEISPGFNFVLSNLTDNAGDIEAMSVNHIAIVPNGRAGSAVRILDSLPPNMKNQENTSMITTEQLQDAVKTAVDAAMKTTTNSKDESAVRSAFQTALTDSLKPVLDTVAEMKAARDKADADAAAKAADEKATKEKDELIAKVTADERSRYALIQDAKPFIPADKHEALIGMDSKAILVAAVGDSIEGAADMETDVLRGVLLGMQKAAASRPAADQLPAGVVPNGPTTPTPTLQDMYSERYNNRNKRGA